MECEVNASVLSEHFPVEELNIHKDSSSSDWFLFRDILYLEYLEHYEFEHH